MARDNRFVTGKRDVRAHRAGWRGGVRTRAWTEPAREPVEGTEYRHLKKPAFQWQLIARDSFADHGLTHQITIEQ
jgi:hypothetical protein